MTTAQTIRNAWVRTQIFAYQFRRIWRLLAAIHRLQELTAWARRQRRVPLVRYYSDKRYDLEHRLTVYRFRARALVVLCEFLFTAYLQLKPDPRAARRRKRKTPKRTVRRSRRRRR